MTPKLFLLLFSIAAGLHANVVTDWNASALQAVRSANTAPPAAARNLAILHGAIYDAVNGIVRTHSYLLVGRDTPGSTNSEAAAVAAAHTVLTSLYPEMQQDFDALAARYLTSSPDTAQRRHGLSWGTHVAMVWLQARKTDGSDKPAAFLGGIEPGEWRPTISFGGVLRPALLPGWGSVRPFGIPETSMFRPVPPPALTSAEFAAELNQVKSLGSAYSSTRTAEQTEIALFWAYGPNTATPPGHWNQIAQAIVTQRPQSLAGTARLFALLNVAMADAGIVTWECKYRYNFWRPITAIQNADTDENPATDADLSWTPLLPTPPFPEYVSGHSAFSGAAAAVLARYFKTDELTFSLQSDDLPSVVRRYQRLSAAAYESGLSRVLGGIHFMSANLNGLAAGDAVGRYIYDHLATERNDRWDD